LEKELAATGKLTEVLDGDNIRNGLNNNLGFSGEDRLENIRRIAEVTKLFVHCGIITICSFVSPTHLIRNTARNIIGEADFVEVYISTSLEVCEKRDVKGLYAKARKGELKDFTGVQTEFEAPIHPALALDTATSTPEACAGKIIAYLNTRSVTVNGKKEF
jgi:adenylylsulfate kinase